MQTTNSGENLIPRLATLYYLKMSQFSTKTTKHAKKQKKFGPYTYTREKAAINK